MSHDNNFPMKNNRTPYRLWKRRLIARVVLLGLNDHIQGQHLQPSAFRGDTASSGYFSIWRSSNRQCTKPGTNFSTHSSSRCCNVERQLHTQEDRKATTGRCLCISSYLLHWVFWPLEKVNHAIYFHSSFNLPFPSVQSLSAGSRMKNEYQSALSVVCSPHFGAIYYKALTSIVTCIMTVTSIHLRLVSKNWFSKCLICKMNNRQTDMQYQKRLFWSFGLKSEITYARCLSSCDRLKPSAWVIASLLENILIKVSCDRCSTPIAKQDVFQNI